MNTTFVGLNIGTGGAIGLANLGVLEEALEPCFQAPDTMLSVDLSAVQDLSPAAAAALLSALRHRAHDGGLDVARCRPPETPSLCRWFSPGALALLTEPGTGLLPARHADEVGFDGCEPFADGEAITRASYALRASLKKNPTISDEMLASLEALISALSENVLRHGTVKGGVVAAGLPVGTGELEVAVADRGIGMRRSLARNPDYSHIKSDAAAIECALEPGVSGASPSGGLGLFMAREVVSRNGGSLMIASGNGTVSTPRVLELRPRVQFRGTLAVARIRIDRPFDYQAVDDEASSPGGVRVTVSGRSDRAE